METSGICKDILRYLSGEKIDFSDYELDFSELSDFERAVLERTRLIPYGKTLTYSELAEAIGKPGAARAVGTALSKNPYPLIIPCHRVVRKDGIGNYTGGGTKVKKKLLDMEK
ncbi:methylated-DNA-[protein]-cysteine S-methyltransferase [Methanohalophilus levihalophilus]|uniref:methylated-DNA--[protein]-cysteine S-methyltransferase n=1 Tax=Methanohalophilus levihalophilus TaxID=1431282 RepID=UPI001AE5D00E|nr:MGMT family protein [Methanohalophilus levihalophilus]MBP2030635.1 methylated-DNA-[protein]-cysteine S-methyltransferase [Methanohalophilus levihalophilus]